MAKQFKIEQLDQKRLIKENDLNVITNPSMFNSNNGPTPDGLLSNEIFGLTKDERSGIFAYLDLKEKFIQPYFYKIWLKLDKNLRSCIYETKNFVIDKNGYLVENDNGETGLKFLMKNIDKINFKSTKKDEFITVLRANKELIFTDKFIIIPPFYRDVNNTGSGRMGVGEINKLYINLINNIRALSESNDYGLSMAGSIRGKIQDLILEIYKYLTIGETPTGEIHAGSGIFKKFGVMRRSVLAKTTDNSCRLVLSAPNINVNSIDDLMVDMEYSAIPLSAVCVLSYPYMIYHLRQFFNNEFGGKSHYSVDNDKDIELKNPQIEFSDDRFDREINEFIHGYSNRLKSIQIPNTQNSNITLRFKGYSITEDEYKHGIRENDTIIERDMTWMDLLFISAIEAVEDKMALITRFPVEFAASL